MDLPYRSILPCVTVTPYSTESMGQIMATQFTGLAAAVSATYPASNTAYFYPFTISEPCIAVKLFSMNGATASGNIDMGIYNRDGVKLVSIGSTAQAGTNAIQEYDITDTRLGSGIYYLAVAKNDTTGTLFRNAPPLTMARAGGMLQMGTAMALPATATFAAATANFVPVIGLTIRSVI